MSGPAAGPIPAGPIAAAIMTLPTWAIEGPAAASVIPTEAAVLDPPATAITLTRLPGSVLRAPTAMLTLLPGTLTLLLAWALGCVARRFGRALGR